MTTDSAIQHLVTAFLHPITLACSLIAIARWQAHGRIATSNLLIIISERASAALCQFHLRADLLAVVDGDADNQELGCVLIKSGA
jgi:hypothetical protein